MAHDLARPRPHARPVAAAAAVAAATLLALGGCSSSGGGSSTATTTTSTTAAPSATYGSPSASTTTAVTTTTAASSTTTTAAAPAALPTDPGAYATAMIQAWVAGDKATASTYGTPTAVDTLFGLESGGEEGSPPPTWALDHCEGAAGSSYCSFKAGGSAGVTLRLVNETVAQAAPHAVSEVRVDG